jgi:hypothetical protein
VYSGADLEAEPTGGLGDRLGAANGAGRAVERGVEAVACGVEFGASIPVEERANRRMVAFDRVLPGMVAELRGGIVEPATSVKRTVAKTRSNSASSR